MAAAKPKPPIESVPWDGPPDTASTTETVDAVLADAYARARSAADRVLSAEAGLRALALRLEQRGHDDRELAGVIANTIAAARDVLRDAMIDTEPSKG